MTITELIEKLKELQQEVGCDGKVVSSHDIPSHVYFKINGLDGTEDSYFNIEDIEMDSLNCMCPIGITIILKKED